MFVFYKFGPTTTDEEIYSNTALNFYKIKTDLVIITYLFTYVIGNFDFFVFYLQEKDNHVNTKTNFITL